MKNTSREAQEQLRDKVMEVAEFLGANSGELISEMMPIIQSERLAERKRVLERVREMKRLDSERCCSSEECGETMEFLGWNDALNAVILQLKADLDKDENEN